MRKILRVCLVSYTYPPNSSGGGDIYAFNIVENLKKLKTEVIVLTSSTAPKKEENGIHFIPIHNIPFYRVPEFLIKARKFCLNLIKSKSIDIFHFNGPSGCCLYRKDLPTVMTIHHSVFSTFKILAHYPASFFSIDTIQECNPFNLWLENISMKSVNQLIAVSHHTASQLKGRGLQEQNIKVIHNGIDIFASPLESEKKDIKNKMGISNEKIILFVGRLDQRKGAIFLVKAVNELRNEIKENFKCILIGNGSQKSQILKYINKNNLMDHFKFIDKISYVELRKFYYLCNVLVLPSLYEGLGLVLLEAMASKKPVIGTNTGGIPEIIKNGKNGLLIPMGSILELTKAIKKVILNEDLANKMGENGYQIIQRQFTWERAVKETLNIYNKLSG